MVESGLHLRSELRSKCHMDYQAEMFRIQNLKIDSNDDENKLIFSLIIYTKPFLVLISCLTISSIVIVFEALITKIKL